MAPASSPPAGDYLWTEVMAFGFGVLRLAPEAFWAMSLPEFLAAMRGVRGEFGRAEPLGRGQFDALMQRFPDFHPTPRKE